MNSKDVKHAVTIGKWFNRYFRKLAVAFQLLVALLGLALALVGGGRWYQRSQILQAGFTNALGSTLEATADPHKGLTAFLISDIENDLSVSRSLLGQMLGFLGWDEHEDASAEQSSETYYHIEASAQAVALELSQLKKEIAALVDTLDEWEPRLDDLPEQSFVFGHTTSPHDQVLLIPSDDFVLRVPLLVVRAPTLSSALFTPGALLSETVELQEMLLSNPEILFDIQVAMRVADHMKEIETHHIAGWPIVQSYFITESGVILLRKAEPDVKQEEHYRNLLPRQFFPERPYFWGAVMNKSKPLAEPFRFVTNPYIDLGGHGLVRTYSIPFDLNRGRVGVLCVDTEVVGNAERTLQARLENLLGATVYPFTWPNDKNILPAGFGWFRDQLPEHESKLLGQIAARHDFRGESTSQPLGFTIPIRSTWVNEKRRTTILAASIDIDALHQKQVTDIMLMAAGVFLFLAGTLNVLQDYRLLRSEARSFLDNMGRVMKETETPFAALDDRNRFLHANDSFTKLLGYTNEHDLKDKCPEFRAMVSTESLPEYEDVLRRSGRGEYTEKYELVLVTKDKRRLHVTAHGERAPFPRLWRKTTPYRFGVFLSWNFLESEDTPQDI